MSIRKALFKKRRGKKEEEKRKKADAALKKMNHQEKKTNLGEEIGKHLGKKRIAGHI
jgi:hypothetical protein